MTIALDRDYDFCSCAHPDHGPMSERRVGSCDEGDAGHERMSWIPLAMGFVVVDDQAICDLCAYAGHVVSEAGGRRSGEPTTRQGDEPDRSWAST